ncbi:MAG: hypothetical protein AAGF11_18115 [Myxococcota bacterium]
MTSFLDPDFSLERHLAPPAAGSSAALELAPQVSSLPPSYVDEHLVEPEAREEMVRGRRDRDRADDAVVRALDAKGTPRLAMIRTQASIETACKLLDIPVDSSRRQYLDALDLRGLRTLLTHLETERCWP